jgi:hypothetical protein
VYAASEFRALPGRDAELCRAASHTDWLYMAGTWVLVGGAIAGDRAYFYQSGQPGIRLIGPSLTGVAWGAALGGALLSRPQCDPDDIHWAPPEGNVHSDMPLVFATALLSLASASFVANLSRGPILQEWPVWERAWATVLPMATGFGGTFLPLLLPPRTYRAAQELQNLRIGGDKTSLTVGYGFSF